MSRRRWPLRLIFGFAAGVAVLAGGSLIVIGRKDAHAVASPIIKEEERPDEGHHSSNEEEGHLIVEEVFTEKIADLSERNIDGAKNNIIGNSMKHCRAVENINVTCTPRMMKISDPQRNGDGSYTITGTLGIDIRAAGK
jgi:hypothetical protein